MVSNEITTDIERRDLYVCQSVVIGFPSGIEDDIMSCEPSWVCDSSDDEADSLRKDPALNLRINYSGMSQSFMEIKKSLEESDAVKRFKSLKRRSLGMQADNDDLTDEVRNIFSSFCHCW